MIDYHALILKKIFDPYVNIIMIYIHRNNLHKIYD